jgi:hypothetical protein
VQPWAALAGGVLYTAFAIGAWRATTIAAEWFTANPGPSDVYIAQVRARGLAARRCLRWARARAAAVGRSIRALRRGATGVARAAPRWRWRRALLTVLLLLPLHAPSTDLRARPGLPPSVSRVASPRFDSSAPVRFSKTIRFGAMRFAALLGVRAQRLSSVVRTVILGLTAMFAGISGVTSVGMYGLFIRVTYGVLTGELDPNLPEPIKSSSEPAEPTGLDQALDALLPREWRR